MVYTKKLLVILSITTISCFSYVLFKFYLKIIRLMQHLIISEKNNIISAKFQKLLVSKIY